MEKTLTRKQKTIGITAILLIALCTVFISYAQIDIPTPTCEVVTIDAPEFAITGEGIEVDLRYTNNGPTGPTFIRLRDRYGNIYSFIDYPNHESDDPTNGMHIYWAMPDEHLIYLVEVGTGSGSHPNANVTDTQMLVVLNENIQAPEPGTTIINITIVYPVIALSPIIDVSLLPGQTMNVTVRIVSLIATAPTQEIKYQIQTSADLNLIKTVWTHNGVLWVPTQTYEISGGDIHLLVLTITLPINTTTTNFTFRVTPVIVG